MSCPLFPSYPHHKTLEPLIYKASIFEWGSRGRRFESSHPDFPEALKNKASGIFYSVVNPLPVVINSEKLDSTPITTPIIKKSKSEIGLLNALQEVYEKNFQQ